MNDKFDELVKNMARSVTRRGALKKFGVGLAGIVLACFGLANRAEASRRKCVTDADCPQGGPGYSFCSNGRCVVVKGPM